MNPDQNCNSSEVPQSPLQLYGDLFRDLHLSGLFPDGKTISDAVLKGYSTSMHQDQDQHQQQKQSTSPVTPIESIRRVTDLYHSLKMSSTPLDLTAFFHQHFEPETELDHMAPKEKPPLDNIDSDIRYQSTTTATHTNVSRLDSLTSALHALPLDIHANTVVINAHVARLWDQLTRYTPYYIPSSSRLPLPYPYVVPGGRFNEMYYWDNYFTLLGLAAHNRHNLVTYMVRNMAYLVDQYGFVPNANRSYYLSRSQPPFLSLMVDVLAQQQSHLQQLLPVAETSTKTITTTTTTTTTAVTTKTAISLSNSTPSPDSAQSVHVDFLQTLLKEYDFWMNPVDHDQDQCDDFCSKQEHRCHVYKHRVTSLEDQWVLNRYYDSAHEPRQEMYADDIRLASSYHQSLFPDSASATAHLDEKFLKSPSLRSFFANIRAACESGWDFSTRWLLDSSSMLSIHTTEIIPIDLNCLLYHLESTIANTYALISKGDKQFLIFQQAAARRKEAIDRVFWSDHHGFYMDYDFVRAKHKPVKSLAAVFPLFFKLASQSQATLVANLIEKEFLKDGGLQTTTINSGQQWDAPNGWAPLQYISIIALRNYQFHELANQIKQKWITNLLNVFNQSGKLVEKYNVVDTTLPGGGGEYPNQDGFGWTNGVLAALLMENSDSNSFDFL